jgi:hypothetical protein
MKKFLTITALLLLSGLPAHAQFSRIIGITGTQNNNAQDFYAASPFTIKAGANCTWATVGTTHTFNCSGGAAASVPFSGITGSTNTTAAMICGTGCSISTTGSGTISATPASPPSSLQYNNAGAFGAVNQILANQANCDGFGTPCDMKVTTNGTLTYLFFGSNSTGMAGNFWDMYESGGSGLFLDASEDGVGNAALALSQAGNDGTFLTNFVTAGSLGFFVKDSHKSTALSRYMISMHAGETPSTGNFVLSGGWGSTATVDQTFGSDNTPKIQITSSGVGQAANPTITFTYKGGAFGATANTPVFVCQQLGGTGLVADITSSSTTTILIETYNGTPVASSTYIIGCYGATAGDN